VLEERVREKEKEMDRETETEKQLLALAHVVPGLQQAAHDGRQADRVTPIRPNNSSQIRLAEQEPEELISTSVSEAREKGERGRGRGRGRDEDVNRTGDKDREERIAHAVLTDGVCEQQAAHGPKKGEPAQPYRPKDTNTSQVKLSHDDPDSFVTTSVRCRHEKKRARERESERESERARAEESGCDSD
jgi:hypothetical protein